MVNDTPDFKKAYIKASEILLLSKEIKSFPFISSKVIQEFFDIEFRTYKYAESKGISRDFWLSDDAEIIECNGMVIIFYNEQMHDVHRLKFSSLHETGHYYMQHNLEKLKQIKRTNNEAFKMLYSRYEIEANFFAAQLLMPEQIINELAKRGCKIDNQFLINTFDVSNEAAEKRIKTLCKSNSFEKEIKEESYDDYIIKKYDSFINKIAPKRKTLEYSLEKEFEMQKMRDLWN